MCSLQVTSVFSPGNFQGFALLNRQRTNRISTGFSVEVSTEGTQLSYSNFDYLGQEPHYWQLPGVYQGDKVSITEHTQQLSLWKYPNEDPEPLDHVHKEQRSSHQKLVDHSFSTAAFIFAALSHFKPQLIFLCKQTFFGAAFFTFIAAFHFIFSILFVQKCPRISLT